MNVSGSDAGAAFNERVASLVSTAPELNSTDLDALAKHGSKVADTYTKHKQTLEKASPEIQHKVGFHPKKVGVSGPGAS